MPRSVLYGEAAFFLESLHKGEDVLLTGAVLAASFVSECAGVIYLISQVPFGGNR